MSEIRAPQCLSWSRAELLRLLVVSGAAAAARLAGLADQGFRLPDEGLYAFLGLGLFAGVPHAVWFKPGQAILLAGAYALLGVSPAASLLPQALLGTLQVPATYLWVRRLWGTDAALVAAAGFATLPFALLYGRSALSDANYLFFDTAGLAFLVAALGLGSGPRRGWGAALAAGVCLGFAFWVNPQASLLAGFGVGAAVLLALARRIAGETCVRALLGGAGGAVMATLAVLWIGGTSIDWGRPADALAVPARIILTFAPSTRWARHLFDYAGPETLVLALAGLGVAVRRRRAADLFVLALGAGLLLFLARTDHPAPRIYFSLTLPVLALAGGGGSWLAAVVSRRLPARPGVVAAGVAAVLAGALAFHGREAFRLQSGLPQACDLLHAESAVMIATSEHCWTYDCFVGSHMSALPDAPAFMKALACDRAPAAVERLLSRLRDEGFTHWVVDAMFWMDADPRALELLRRFLASHPPLARIPHPVASHRATALECHAPAAMDDPAAQWIYVYRLADLDLPRK